MVMQVRNDYLEMTDLINRQEQRIEALKRKLNEADQCRAVLMDYVIATSLKSGLLMSAESAEDFVESLLRDTRKSREVK